MGTSAERIEDVVPMNSTTRSISLDLLRVLCMFMIVLGHSICHGQVLEHTLIKSANYYLTTMLYTFLMVHVNCFVLISGFFLCKQEFKIKKVIDLWLQMLFWSVLLYLILCFFGQSEFGIKGLVKAVLPLTQERYWFMTTYLLMYILVPLLNAAIHAMNQKQYATFLIAFSLVYIVLQNFVFWREFAHLGSNSPFFFAFLYMIAAYIRLYPPRKRNWILGYIIICSFVTIWRILLPIITNAFFGFEAGAFAFSAYNSVAMVTASICLFLTFKDCTPPKSKLWLQLAKLSPLTLGIYLIHDQPECRLLLWQSLLRPYIYANIPALIIILAGMSMVVFSVCTLLECGRNALFRAIKIGKVTDWASDKLVHLIQWSAKLIINRSVDDEEG